MKLLYHVKGWDGKDIGFLVTTYEHYSATEGFQQDLLDSLKLTDRHQSYYRCNLAHKTAEHFYSFNILYF
jgi:hypothetical protein